ncbi:PREDICTED: transmembrane protein 26-like [Wasmannia auropunctata]|uniref:transmembrane protein 26-like n=1 Tax=Wasmannia auropunctata TaxID=64793 RepID=UPI0005EE60F9|nr:PREDICTED: transmembrane protein 26-like [Wasmannia auropunctata]
MGNDLELLKGQDQGLALTFASQFLVVVKMRHQDITHEQISSVDAEWLKHAKQRTQRKSEFCPSVFLYLSMMVPAMWLIDLDIIDKKLKSCKPITRIPKNSELYLNSLCNLTASDSQHQKEDVHIPMEDLFAMINGQFLMLILIIGRWMLPKGDLTRDQLSQLLLVYIGSAADIIEFMDSFDEDEIAEKPVVINWILGVWAWSLLQFTIVLTDTESKKIRLSSGSIVKEKIQIETSCCSVDIWGIVLNIILQIQSNYRIGQSNEH